MPDRYAANLVKTRGWLAPADERSKEIIDSLPAECLATFQAARSPKQHRFWFAFLRKVCEATSYERWPNEDSLRFGLLVALGFTEEYITLDGEVRIKPRSMAIANMKTPEFVDFFKRSINLVCAEILPDVADEFRAEILDMLEPGLRDLMRE